MLGDEVDSSSELVPALAQRARVAAAFVAALPAGSAARRLDVLELFLEAHFTSLVVFEVDFFLFLCLGLVLAIANAI